MDDPLAQLDMPLLLAFEALLREGNITRAARGLGITQPAMSARLGRLRRVFDDKLFVPAAVGRGVIPTPRALSLAPMLADSLDALRRLVRSEPSFDPGTARRTFIVALHDNPAMMVGPRLIERFRDYAPACRLALVTPDYETITADLERGRIDLLIADPRAADPNLIARRLLTERFVTAQRKGHPRGSASFDLDAFCEQDHLLISTDGAGFAGVVDVGLAALGRRRRVAASIQSYALAPFIVQATDLICTLPRRLLSRFENSLELYEPPLEIEAFALSMIWHPRNQDDAGHLWLRGQLEAVARNATA